MNHHTQGPVCLLCDEKLKQGHPVIVDCFRQVKIRFQDTHTSWVWRGEKDQNQFYKEGKSRVLYPNSKHNATLDGDPYSRAMDLFFIGPNGVPSWDFGKLEQVADFLKKENAPIEWGGDWKGGFSDRPHFQLKKEVSQK